MATSKVELCNRALTLCGARRITSLTESSEPAAILNEEYDNSRRELLVGHPWNFALKRIALGLDVTTPAFGFSYRFQLPSDCLRVISTSYVGYTEFQIEGRYLLSNESEASIRYISDITDISMFSKPFEVALAYMLADLICFKISGNAALADRINKAATQKLREARSYDAQEGSAPMTENNIFRDVRD